MTQLRLQFARLAIVGASCSGKTTLARKLAHTLSAPHVELDSLHWGPNWTPRAEDEFRRRVDEATSKPTWVADGNYRYVRLIEVLAQLGARL